ncbi:hypothetical protein KGM_202804A, partial [Danaus plexippus plexippus]
MNYETSREKQLTPRSAPATRK